MIEAVDLFCGAGGLTAGFEAAGLRVLAGFDIEESCRYAYESNNKAKYYNQDVRTLRADQLNELYSQGAIQLLAGCAPCQPFSRYNSNRDAKKDQKWPLLYEFQRLITELNPHLVTMENVPDVVKHGVYHDFLSSLQEKGYSVWANEVNCSDYGVPQERRRHVLLASRLGPIELISPTTPDRASVQDAIGHLPPIKAGEVCSTDGLHKAARLSELNLKRIKNSKPGGTWRDWPVGLRAACHQRATGQSYPSVYGRMEWSKPSPTMTTLCYGYGNGRFGHPEQDRAISLREAALLQTFPAGYEFSNPDQPLSTKAVGRMIGNAVPVLLGQVIGKSFFNHIYQHAQLSQSK